MQVKWFYNIFIFFFKKVVERHVKETEKSKENFVSVRKISLRQRSLKEKFL